MQNNALILLLFITALCASCVTGSGDADWEFTSILEVDDISEVYNLVLAKVDESYAASSMKLVILATTDHGVEGVEAVESTAETLWDSGSTTTITSSDSTALTASSSTVYSLSFDDDEWASVFPLTFSASGEYAFFFEHDPEEFHNDEASPNYLMASDGHAVEFDYTSSSDAEDEDISNNWGSAIGACVLVWFATFAMIVLYHTFSHLSFCKESFLKLDSMQMFASGTLMSSAFALIVFESSRSLTEETGVASMWMFVLVLGFLTSSILDTFAHALIDNNVEIKEFATVPREAIDDEMNSVPDNGDVELKKVPSTTAVVALNADMEAGNDIAPGCECEGCELKVDPKLKQCRTYLEVMQDTSARKTALSIFIGDFVCNYCDGLVIASAFSACTTVLGWSIATVTILHELPQELADYAILVEQLKLNASTAALNNLICGFGVLLGAFTIMGTEIGTEFQAYFLAFGAGNFIYLAAVEFFSLARAKDATFRDKIEKIFFFLLGVAIIAIIARDHAHCEANHADETADAHADH